MEDSLSLIDASVDSRNLNSVQERAKAILADELQFIDNPAFRDKASRRQIERSVEQLCSVRPKQEFGVENLPAHLARLCEQELLTAESERELFRAMNYLKHRANTLRAGINIESPNPEIIEEIETLVEKSVMLRDQLILANLRLVIAIVKKFVSPTFSFDELLSDGIEILMNAVEKFDFERGFRFSTYAYRSISRNAYRKVVDRQKDQARNVTVEDGSIEGPIEGFGTTTMDEKTWERLRSLLDQFMNSLDSREQMIVQARYALGQHHSVKTFQSLADELGVSKERVRQLEQRAVKKLQKMAIELGSDVGI